MLKNLAIGDLTIDCASPEQTREFYANLTGWKRCIAFNAPALQTAAGLTVLFAGLDVPYDPPVWPEELGKPQKQMHFNFQVDDLPAAVAEAVKLGATKSASQYGGAKFVTMLAPEGHPFCLCEK